MKSAILGALLVITTGCTVEVNSGFDQDDSTGDSGVSPQLSDSIISEESMKDLVLGKHTFFIGDGSFSRTGSSDRTPDLHVKAQLGLVSKEKLSIEQKITALEEKAYFYKLMLEKGIDLETKVTRSYSSVTLSEILDDLIPQIEVVYDNYKDEEKIHRLNIKDAELEHLIGYLDDAAKARFRFADNKLIVTKE